MNFELATVFFFFTGSTRFPRFVAAALLSHRKHPLSPESRLSRNLLHQLQHKELLIHLKL